MIYNQILNDYEKICNPCAVYMRLFVIFFIRSVSISSVCVYFPWYLERDQILVKFNLVTFGDHSKFH